MKDYLSTLKTPGDHRVHSNLRDITEKLMHGLTENEINSALIFVAVARTAFRAAEFSDGHAALSKAEAIYAQARELAHDSSPRTQLAIGDSLRELRRAIDDLLVGQKRELTSEAVADTNANCKAAHSCELKIKS